MLFKRVLIAKLILQIGIKASIAIDLYPNVSKNLHKTQVFIFYNKAQSLDQVADCLGTILSPRFILTTAMCIELDTLKLKNAVITRALGTDGHKTLAPDQTNNIDTYRIEKFTYHPDFRLPERNFPDFAILKLTKDIANSEDAYVMNQKVEEFYLKDQKQKHLGVYFLKFIYFLPKQPTLIFLIMKPFSIECHNFSFQMEIATFLTGQRRGYLNQFRSHYNQKKSVQLICVKQKSLQI